MMKKFNGVSIITRYDRDGVEQESIAKPDFEDRFSWFLFAVMIFLALAVFAQVV
jgi:hypothetical protein